jgi:hypothetical protein
LRGLRYPPVGMAGALALLCALPLAASQRMDLDRGWQFRTDPGDGLSLGWNSAIPAGTETVVAPHTWNIGELHDYNGVAWYFRALEQPSIPAGGHLLSRNGTVVASETLEWNRPAAVSQQK